MAGAIDTGRGIAARLAGLTQAVSGDPVLLRRGRCLDTICQLNIGDEVFLLRIVDGNTIESRAGPFVTPSADFAISGDETVWQRFLAADPPPGDHDLFAFVKRGELLVTGDLHPLMSDLHDTSWLHRPDVNGGEVAAGVVSGLIAPQAPAAERWETLWHYMQAGPGVFRGDLYFYGVDGDVRAWAASIPRSARSIC